MNEIMKELTVVLTGVIGVALLAVLVSKNAQSDTVIKAAGSSFASILQAAVSPVTGQSLGMSGLY